MAGFGTRDSVVRLFEAAFGGSPDVVVEAPGRVNLIGEHVDYNGGYVLPLAIAQSTKLALRLRDDGQLRAASAQFDEGVVRVSGDPAGGSFVAHLMGAYWALRSAGHHVATADIAVDSEVPIGSGLSSSAALLVATLRAFREVGKLELSDLSIARLAHRAEREFVGVPVGTMDQMACSLGGQDCALFLNTDTLQFERIPMPKDVEVVVIDSGVRHEHASGGYRTRRSECEQAAALLGVARLCDLPSSQDPLMAWPGWSRLSATLQMRVRHVVAENRRVLRAVHAMRCENLSRLGYYLDKSHASLRDLFEVSTPQVDALVEATREASGCFGARMTGGGFGGAIVALASKGTGENVARTAVREYVARVPSAKPKVIMPTLAEDLQ